MALTNCPDCSLPVSDQAAVCLNCGRPIKQSLPGKLAAKTKSTGSKFVSYCREIAPVVQKTILWLFAAFAVSGLTFVFVLLLKAPGDLSTDGKVVMSGFLSVLLFLLYYYLVVSTKKSDYFFWSSAVISLSILKIGFALPCAFALPASTNVSAPVKHAAFPAEPVEVLADCEFETVADANAYELFMKQKKYLEAYKKAIPGSKSAKTAKRLYDFDGYKSRKPKQLKTVSPVAKDALLKIILDSTVSPSLARIHSAIKAGADVNARVPETGVTVLMFAVANWKLEIVDALINAGAHVNEASYKGWTPLMGAALRKDVSFIKLLVKAGADVNAKTKDGTTALMSAAWLNKNPSIVKALLFSGADTNVKCNNGYLAFDYAQLNKWLKNTPICDLLKNTDKQAVLRSVTAKKTCNIASR